MKWIDWLFYHVLEKSSIRGKQPSLFSRVSKFIYYFLSTFAIVSFRFKFGFEYHKDIVRLFEMKIVSCKDKSCEYNLSLGIINFAKMWMKFVTERCERGRGVRPRWATLGLEFLIAACDPYVHVTLLLILLIKIVVAVLTDSFMFSDTIPII